LDGKHLNGKHDRIIAAAPLFHIMGLVLMAHVPIYLGVPVYVMTRFSLPQFLETVQNRKITYTVVAPPVILLLAKDPIVNDYDLSSLRLVVSGAAPLGAEISTQAKQRVPTMVVKQGYGTTETSACVFIQPTERIINGKKFKLHNLENYFTYLCSKKVLPVSFYLIW
jgi:acyl-CoA synthetase (AMP-forming)/AMP-acid ligase II